MFDKIRKEIEPFYFEWYTAEKLYSHLKYTGCVAILEGVNTYKTIPEMYKEMYAGLFNKGFTEQEFEEYMGKPWHIFKDALAICQTDRSKIQLNALRLEWFKNFLEQKEYSEDDKNKLISLYEQTTMSEGEIVENITAEISWFRDMNNKWESERTYKSLSLTSVGMAIAIINFNVKTGQDINVKQYLW